MTTNEQATFYYLMSKMTPNDYIMFNLIIKNKCDAFQKDFDEKIKNKQDLINKNITQIDGLFKEILDALEMKWYKIENGT